MAEPALLPARRPFSRRLILSLCDFSGTWSKPYADAGYAVIRLDLKNGHDIRLARRIEVPVQGILAAPPCTMFANSGARWKRTPEQVLDALSIVDACLRLAYAYRPKWWVLENPVGKLRHYLGPPVATFDPCDYGDPYTKKTCLWGEFVMPPKHRVEPVKKSPIHYMPPGPHRADLRSITPAGFARAFFEANP